MMINFFIYLFRRLFRPVMLDPVVYTAYSEDVSHRHITVEVVWQGKVERVYSKVVGVLTEDDLVLERVH